MIVDSHAHLDDGRFDDDRELVIEQIKQAGIDRVINIGSNMKSSLASLHLSMQYDFIYAAVGIHPHDASTYSDENENRLIELLANEKVVAVGEIGLDYHYDFSPRDMQMEAFIRQIKLSNQLKLPMIIHDREAHKPVLDTLTRYKDSLTKGVFHSYSGSKEMIPQVLGLNFYLSFNGITTFKNAKNVHEAVRHTPLDRLLIETDSPYLTPAPNRGKRNDSRNVIYVAKAIAEIKEITVEEVFEASWKNTNDLFSLPVF
ncbi:MAG: TatD family hydrolase [Clostridia bacterium]|nr:TatD family hydrolase [Clostridia bacterium]